MILMRSALPRKLALLRGPRKKMNEIVAEQNSASQRMLAMTSQKRIQL
jgi:hypothetical protein